MGVLDVLPPPGRFSQKVWLSGPKSSVILFVLAAIFVLTASAQVDTGWVRRYATQGTDIINALCLDRDGNIYCAGYTTPSGNTNMLVLKYRPDGTLVWAREYDGPAAGIDIATSIVVNNSGNVFITGYATTTTGPDYCTIRYDSLGNQEWVRFYDGPVSGSEYATAITLDNQGNVIVTGYSPGSGTADDYCTIKYSPDGTQRWVARYNNPAANSNDRAVGVATDPQGNVYVTGQSIASNWDYLTVKYNANGSQQWAARYNGDGNGVDYAAAIVVDESGNCYITGSSMGSGTADMDYVTIKYSTSGTREWVARYNGSGNDYDYGYGIALDQSRNVLVIGNSIGLGTALYDYVTLKYDNDGNLRWERRFDGGSYDYGRGIAVDSAGNCYVTGNSYRTNNYDFLVVSYDPAGNTRWFTYYNDVGNGTDYPTSVRVDRTGNVYCAGYRSGGSGTGSDALLVKYIQPDVASRRILSPDVRVDTASTVTPGAVVANLGSSPANIKSYFIIRRSTGPYEFYDSVLVSGVQPGDSVTITFSSWPKPYFIGPHIAVCSTVVARDRDLSNNVIRKEFQVVAGPFGWLEIASVPLTPSGRAVKDGGCLAYSYPHNRIYCVKGNRTGDFYYYQPGSYNWVTLPLIPNGPSGKTPGKGACLAADNNGFLYLVRGEKTLEFWRFNPDSTTWTQMEDIPPGPYGRPVKGGSDIAFVPQDNSLYLLKGYRNEFYRYSIADGHWYSLPEAPLPDKPKWDKGSFLVYDGDHSLYAGKAKLNELWRFDIYANEWDTIHRLTPLPFYGRNGRSAKLKDGGCAVYYEGNIYVLKGSNTCEFWCYYIDGDSWQELEPMPEYGSTGKRKRIKAGADMVFGGDALYALKGNKTVEFWRYAFPPSGQICTGGPQESRKAVLKRGGGVSALVLSPQAAGSRRMVRWIQAQDGTEVAIRVFDSAGRLRQREKQLVRNGAITVEFNGLAPGVYLLLIEGDNFKGTCRVVLGQ